MREFISHEQLLAALDALGVPHDVLSVELEPRHEPFPGMDSSWMLRYTRGVGGGGCDGQPYRTETTYVPVLLPYDEARRLARLTEADRLRAELAHDRDVAQVFLPDVVDADKMSLAERERERWKHCENARPHESHLHDVTVGDLTYRDMFCVGVSETGGWCAPPTAIL